MSLGPVEALLRQTLNAVDRQLDVLQQRAFEQEVSIYKLKTKDGKHEALDLIVARANVAAALANVEIAKRQTR